MNVSGLAVSGSGFAISGGSCAGAAFELAIGASCDVQLTYTANDLDADVGALDFNSDAPSNIPSATLSGDGIQGNLQVSPANIDFGDVLVGATSAAQSVTLTNAGSAAMNVSGLAVSGSGVAISGGSCEGAAFELEIGASCDVQATYTVNDLDADVGALDFNADAPSDIASVALAGSGIQGNLQVSPANIDFGDVLVGATSAAQAVTLTNAGSAAMNVSGLAVSGSGFAISGGSCAGAAFELEIGASCDVQLTYTANDLDADAGALDFNADAPSNIASVALAGSGIQGNLQVRPASIDFGAEQRGAGSAAQAVRQPNAGSAAVSHSGAPDSGSGFAIRGGSCAGTAFERAIGASCDVQLTYSANDLNADVGALDFNADAPANIASVALAGTGIQGNLQVSPASIDF